MLRICTLLLLALFFALPLSAASTPASLKEVVSALEKGFAGLQDVQADFSQKTTISPSFKTFVAIFVPTIQGLPISRATIAA